jgi:hypothetical protein
VAWGFMCPLLGNSLLSGLTVWTIPVWLVHSMVSPTLIVMLPGLNAMPFMVTLWVSAISSALAGTSYGALSAAIRKFNNTPALGGREEDVAVRRQANLTLGVQSMTSSQRQTRRRARSEGIASVDGMGGILGYARVSTGDQDVAGQTLRLTQAGAIRVFTDVRSGRSMDRRGLDALLAYARDKIAAALKLVKAGLSPTAAARQLGLGRSTVYREVGRADIERTPYPVAGLVRRTFCLSVVYLTTDAMPSL